VFTKYLRYIVQRSYTELQRCHWPKRRHFQTTTYRRNDSANKPTVPPPGVPYSSLTVGIPREIFPNERRVSLTPQNAALLRKKGFAHVLVEHQAGVGAEFLDEHYTAAGATLVSRDELFKRSDIMLKVRPPLIGQEAEKINEGSTVISFLYPAQNKAIVDTLAARKANAFAVRCRFELFHCTAS
jgi:NAD(P) transhydrogenase